MKKKLFKIEPYKIEWHGMKLVKISDVPGFSEWLGGQTMPFVYGVPDPFDWAYEDDYERFIQGLPVID